MKRYGPALATIAIYWSAVALALAAAIRGTDGHLVYPLDDTYIHMAIARNVALHHVWGVTRYGFDSATSSPLWTLLLSLTYLAAGVRVAAPVVLNLIAGTLIVVMVDAVMRARSAGLPLRLLVLIAIVFLAPLPTLTVLGMEHLLHALATLWFVFAAASLLASSRPPAMADLVRLGALGALAAASRYEGLFALTVVALLLLATRGLVAAAVVGAIGVVPAVGYGLWSIAHGWYFLPNSLLLKGTAPEPSVRGVLTFLSGAPAIHNLLANPHMLVLVVAALTLLVVVTAGPMWDEDVHLLTILAGTTLLHMQFARAGWFYRYEAYLVTLGVAVFGAVAARRLPRPLLSVRPAAFRVAVAVARFAVAGVPFVSRGVNAWRNIPAAASNIYHQQYQMGLFLDRFYRGGSVAVNDIGAVSFLADIHLLDIFGLANLDILRLRRAQRYDSSAIAASAAREHVDLAIVYPSWLGEYGGVPRQWIQIGQWIVRDNVVLGANAVAFYAVREGERGPLTAHLQQFFTELPPEVTQTGVYVR